MPEPLNIYRNNERLRRERHGRSVLRIFLSQGDDGPLLLRGSVDESRPPTNQHVPEAAPVLDIVIDEQCRPGIGPHIFDAPQLSGAQRLRLGVDRVVERLPEQHEANRHHRGRGAVGRREMPDPRPIDAPAPRCIDHDDVKINHAAFSARVGR